MRKKPHRTVQLGELVVAVFDEAARFSTDPQEISRFATQTVVHMLRRLEGDRPHRRCEQPASSRQSYRGGYYEPGESR